MSNQGIIHRLEDIAEECAKLSIRRVFNDRQFCAADAIDILEQHDLFYVILAKHDDSITRMDDDHLV